MHARFFAAHAVVATLLFASGSRADDPAPTTRRRAVVLGGASGALAFSGAFLPVPSIYRYAFQLASPAPLLATSEKDYASSGSAQAAWVAGSATLRQATRHDNGFAPPWITAEEFSLHQAFYSSYASYRDARAQGTSPAWSDAWRPWMVDELAVAPFRAKNLKPTIVAASLSVEAGLLGGLVGLSYLGGGPHPTSSSKYARDLALGTALAWNAGITEEAFFRGFYYEELKLSLGKWPARLIDMATFTLAHVPGEIEDDVNASAIYVGLLTRAVGGLLFEIAYDEGGLPTSVALHALWDVIAFAESSSLGAGPFGPNVVLPIKAIAGAGARPDVARAPTGSDAVMVPIFSGRF